MTRPPKVIDFEYVIPQPSKPCMIINSIIKFSIQASICKCGEKLKLKKGRYGCICGNTLSKGALEPAVEK